MANSSTEKAAEYDRRFPGALDDFDQKVERMERIEMKNRRREGGRGVRFFSVPELPWKKGENG